MSLIWNDSNETFNMSSFVLLFVFLCPPFSTHVSGTPTPVRTLVGLSLGGVLVYSGLNQMQIGRWVVNISDSQMLNSVCLVVWLFFHIGSTHTQKW